MSPRHPEEDSLEDAAEQRRLRLRQRRPISHKCVLVFFALGSIAVFALMAQLDTTPDKLGITLAIGLGPLISVAGIVAFRLSKLTYAITSLCLLAYFVGTMGLLLGTFKSENVAGVASHATSLAGGMGSLLITGLLIWRYTFGTTSRTYYGFGAAIAPPALPKTIPPTHRGRSRSGAEEPLDY